MATDTTTADSSFTDLVVPFTTTNGMGDMSTGHSTLTGYTLAVTKFLHFHLHSLHEN